MLISVVIPTFNRPADLARCLQGILRQGRPADQLIVVVRDGDDATRAEIAKSEMGKPPVLIASVSQPGQVAALNAGLDRAASDILCITDDDAVPRPDWLARIEAHFQADPSLGGVGGRDWVHERRPQAELISSDKVGRITWYGKATGHHHLGFGNPSHVHILKGANMSYRRAAIGPIRFDTRLRGSGAQVHNDLAFSLAVRRAGWKLVYDPEVAVDHYPAQRFDADQRAGFNRQAVFDATYNETLAILTDRKHPSARVAFLSWSILVGTRSAYGLVQLARFLPTQRAEAIARWSTAMRGRLAGWKTAGIRAASAKTRDVPLHTHDDPSEPLNVR